MSSATSTSEAPPSGGSKPSDTLQPWQLFTLAGLIGATIVVFMSRGQSAAGVILLSLLVFSAAAIGSAALRAFLPLTQKIPASEPQILGGRTRAALEREKTLVLRSIKELEFDRAMKKVSEKDFAEMSGRLRARAARLMRQLDAGSLYRGDIEREIERRLAGGAASRGSGAQPDQPHTEDIRTRPVAAVCASCETPNDADARFCKSCGARLGAAP
jgi:hypothetical protein